MVNYSRVLKSDSLGNEKCVTCDLAMVCYVGLDSLGVYSRHRLGVKQFLYKNISTSYS